MWTVTLNNITKETANISATYVGDNCNFTWSATVKLGDHQKFCDIAKEQLAKHIETHKDDVILKQTIEEMLNG